MLLGELGCRAHELHVRSHSLATLICFLQFLPLPLNIELALQDLPVARGRRRCVVLAVVDRGFRASFR